MKHVKKLEVYIIILGITLVAQTVKNLPEIQETGV